MTRIFYKKELMGIKISSIKKGSLPITDNNEPLQIVSLKHPKNTYLKAHTHAPKKRVTSKMQECLFLIEGKLKIDLYGSDKRYFKYIYLNAGQAFMVVNGGYGIHILHDSVALEFKNGPFDEDKILIDEKK